MSPRILFALAALAPVCHADLTVGQPGDGADFTDIASALAVATAGETVFVLPGTYTAGFSINQGVNLVGAGSDQTFLVAPSTGRHLDVTGVGAGQAVRVVGFGLTGATEFGSGVALVGNGGSVTLAELVYAPSTGATGSTSSGAEALLDIQSCLQVLLDKVDFDASDLEDAVATGTYGMNAESALVFATDCDFAGGGELGSDGRPGVRLATAELWLTSTNITGADGAIVVSDDPATPVPAGGAGIAAILGSRIEIFGGLGQVIRGGDGGGVIDTGGTPQSPGDGGPGLLMADSTSAVLAGGLLQGGVSPLGVSAPPSITDPSSTLFFFIEPQIGLISSASLVQPGDTVILEAAGLSGSSVGVFFALETVPPVYVPPFSGLVQIAPLQPAPLVTLQLSPFGGGGSLPVPIPPFLPPGFRAYFQAVDLTASIAPSVSMPTMVQVGL